MAEKELPPLTTDDIEPILGELSKLVPEENRPIFSAKLLAFLLRRPCCKRAAWAARQFALGHASGCIVRNRGNVEKTLKEIMRIRNKLV